ncbi:uncharacterized protein TRIVIDRAFT_122435, partial [Trichoderma virens Gv29-8]
VLLLAGIAAIIFLWLWLSAGNKQSSIPPNSARRSLTFRISSIPRGVDREKFRDILTRLPTTNSARELKWTLLGFSYSPSAAPSQAQRYAVATATFANAPTLSELEKSIKREIGIDASRLKVDSDFFGLTPLADPSQDVAVDIIAVTGLAGHAFGSWKSKNKPDMWLRDFLPEAVPNARILTYGYDTKLPGSQSEASIPDLSRRLLESIKTIRSGHAKNRPLILMGHSLGGLVVKEAIAEAFEGSEDDQAIFRSCYALMLFAVPNRGLDNSNLMYMVRGQPNEDLVKDLKQSSRFLNMLGQRFNKYFTLDDSKIICIYETRMTPTIQTASWERTGSKVMMVPFTSAIHAGPNEKVYDQIPIEADHSEIVKFSDISNPDYLMMESRIRELVAKAPGIIQERFAKLGRNSEKRYIEALKAPDYAAFRNHKVDNPTPGTLGWILKNELLHLWLTTNESSVLWVKGSPGQGKTILAKFLLTHIEDLSLNSHRRTTVIYFFFYDQDDNCRTVGAALRSLITQLLSVKDAFQIISDKFDIETSTITDESTWAILKELLQSPVFGTIYCVIDALDECRDHESRHRLLELFKALVQPPIMRRREKFPPLKAFLTSRPTVDLGRSLKPFPSIHLKASSDDIKTFTLSKIHPLELATELECRVIELLSSRVEQTFLWISIVLKKLKAATTLLSQADIEQIINESPSDLTDLYESIIGQIMQSNDIAAQKLLIWTVFGRRALTLNELEEALAIQENSKSKESIRKYRIPLTESAITSAAGVILDIIAGKVYLIHQSAKEFLLNSEYLATAEFCRGLRPSMYLAKTCMTYLCFTDFIETGPCRDPALLDERNRHHPFFRYAARNWHRHIGVEDDIKNFTGIICQLTKPGSSGLLAWGEAAGIANFDKAVDAWDIATKADIPWLAEFQSKDIVVTEEMIEKAAIKLAARNRESGRDVIELMLHNANTNISEGAVAEIALRFSVETMMLLLNSREDVKITEMVIDAAIRREHNREEMVSLLLEQRVQDIQITEKIAKTIAEEFDEKMMISLLENGGQDFQITEEVIKAAARNRKNCKQVMALLFNQRGDEIAITEEVVKAATRRSDAREMITFLLNRKDGIAITEVIKAAVRIYDAKEMMTLLLNHRKYEIAITEEIVKVAVGRHDAKDIITLLLNHRGGQIAITEEVVKAAAGGTYGKEVMILLLNHRGDKIAITEEVVKAAAGGYDSKEVMTLLLEKRGDEITITEEVVKAAAGGYDGKEVMTLLFDKRGDEIAVTEEVLKAAAGGPYGEEVMTLLFDKRGDEITITEEVVKAAAGGYDGKEVMALLFNQRGDEIAVTEEVFKAAAGGPCGKGVMALLLSRRGVEITVTEKVVKAAAGNGWNGKEVMALLLSRRGDEITITEEVIKVAAGNKLNGKEVMALLHNHRGKRS